MSLEWYNTITECSESEKAWLLESIYRYQLFGEIPVTEDRFLKIIFNNMKQFFDYNGEKYEERKIQNSLNQQKRWAEAKKDSAKIAAIEEQKRFLKTHSASEYTNVYGRIPMYTDNDNDTDIGIDNESDYENDNESDSDNDNEHDSDCGDGYGVLKGRREITLPELQQYHDTHGYTFDCRKAYSAKNRPLYEDELTEKCKFWESISKG